MQRRDCDQHSDETRVASALGVSSRLLSRGPAVSSPAEASSDELVIDSPVSSPFASERSAVRKLVPVRWCKSLLRAGAIAVTCGICAAGGFLYGAYAISELANQELASAEKELQQLREMNAQVQTQQSYLKTVFEDLVSSHDQMRQIQDAPRQTRKSRVWYSIGGERRTPLYRNAGGVDVALRDAPKEEEMNDVAKLAIPQRSTRRPDLVLSRWAQIFATLPLGVPVDGYISSPYGARLSPTSGNPQHHTGVDFAVETQTTVVSTGEGRVREAGYKGAYGLSVVVDHGNGWQTLYGHLSAVRTKVGDKLCRGEVVGLVGSTGNSTGPHLHYEVRRSELPRNPMPFIEFPRVASLMLKAFGG